MNQLNYLTEQVPSDRLIPNICCTYHMLIGRLYSIVRSECKDKQPNAANLLKSLIDSSIKEVINFGCNKYPDIKTCDKKIGGDMKNLRQLRFSAKRQHAYIREILSLTTRIVNFVQ